MFDFKIFSEDLAVGMITGPTTNLIIKNNVFDHPVIENTQNVCNWSKWLCGLTQMHTNFFIKNFNGYSTKRVQFKASGHCPLTVRDDIFPIIMKVGFYF